MELPGQEYMKTMDKSIKLPDRWKDWEITKSIGSGSYGDVYEAVYRGANPSVTTRKVAVKVIRIPSGSAEAAALAHEMPDIEDRIQYCQNIVDGLLSEIRTMEALRDNGHVVALQDYYVDYNETLPEWTIYIRMELLTPLSDYLETHTPDEKLVLRLGTQMCSALEECGEKGILHRDIKPENIMVTEDGTFKLGDFGLARQLDLTTASLSLKGTFTYMAPEVYHGEKYGVKADQYSLGIVLYRLLNRNRDPFVDPAVDMVYYKDREEALRRRMSGEQLPPPAEASEQLAAVIGKACAFSPDDRYDSISDLKHDLLVCAGEGTKTGAAKKGRKPLLIGIAAAILLAVIGVFASGILTKNPAILSGNSTEEKSGECGENVRWEVTEDGVLTISGQGMMDNYEILDQPPYHFNEISSTIKELHINEGVTGIGDYAFYMIFLMQNVELPESLEYIGDFAFSDSWSLLRFDVGKNVTHIGQGILSSSNFLTSITVDADNPVYDSRNDCNAIIHTATDTLIAGCNNTIIPDGVKAIGPEAFSGFNEIKEIRIPDSVESIDDKAFWWVGEDFVICGSAGSAAEKYAASHGFQFREQ